MSTLKTTKVTHKDNSGSPNMQCAATGNTVFAADIQSTSQNTGQLAGFRNQFINGDFRIWQRGPSITFGTTAGGYTADRFFAPANTINSQRNRFGGIPVYEIVGGDGTHIQQAVELYRDPSGDTLNVVPGPFSVGSVWTLSYYANKPPHPAISLNYQFRDVANVENPASVPIGTISLPTATGRTLGSGNELTQYSTTFTVTGTPSETNTCANFHIAGDTAGVYFAYAQLEPGPVATPFENRPIGMELALCQRYYEKGEEIFLAQRIDTGAAYFSNYWRRSYKQTKRVDPTINATMTSGGTFGMTTSSTEELNCSGYIYGDESGPTPIAFTFTADAEL